MDELLGWLKDQQTNANKTNYDRIMAKKVADEIERLQRKNSNLLGLLDGMRRNIALTLKAYSDEPSLSDKGNENA